MTTLKYDVKERRYYDGWNLHKEKYSLVRQNTVKAVNDVLLKCDTDFRSLAWWEIDIKKKIDFCDLSIISLTIIVQLISEGLAQSEGRVTVLFTNDRET